MRKLLDALDKETGELFSPRSKSRVIGSALEEYEQARAQMRRLSLSGAAVKEKQVELERAKASRDALNAETDLLREQLTKLHRIAGSKPDVARLQELRTALAVLEWVPALPANARRQRDQAAADLTDATAQIEILTTQIAQRTEKIKALPVSDALKAHAREIEALNAGTHDYMRGILDLPKRRDDHNKVIQRAEMEWRTIWHQRRVSDAEQLRSAYARKTEIHALITEHARLIVTLEQSEESLRSDRDAHDRLSRELAASAEPRDPATLLASIEQSKRLGDTGEATSRLQSECKRMDRGDRAGSQKPFVVVRDRRRARISVDADALDSRAVRARLGRACRPSARPLLPRIEPCRINSGEAGGGGEAWLAGEYCRREGSRRSARPPESSLGADSRLCFREDADERGRAEPIGLTRSAAGGLRAAASAKR